MAAGTGLAAAVVIGLAAFAVGRVTGSEGRVLVEAMLPTSRFLCSAVMTAGATILALMLTLLGLSINADADLDPTFYRRIKQIALYDMLVLVVATCFLVLHCIPITKSDEIPSWWYSTAYYSVLVISAVLAGALISVVGMLYAAVRDIIHAIGLEHDLGLREHMASGADDSRSGEES